MDDHKLWKQIIDHKYRTDAPNTFACPDQGLSPFWKGVMGCKGSKDGISVEGGQW
jgi:hypothetical protein